MGKMQALQIEDELLKLYEKEYEKLYSIAFRMVGNHHDAEDVMQSAFLKTHRGRFILRHDIFDVTMFLR